MAAFGFRGLGYFDVVSILEAPVCRDPRHPCTRADSARYWAMCAEIARREFGGFASEGSMDHFAGSLDSVLYAAFDLPPDIERTYHSDGALASRHVPIFQIVYNGIMLQNPFTATVNPTVQSFYFHSKFVSNGTDWMGEGDLSCATDEALAASAAKIREGCDLWRPFARLQYEFIDGHERLADGVFLTTWSDGTRLVTNYTDAPFVFEGQTVGALDYALAVP